MKHVLILAVIGVFAIVGCSQKKVDAEKLKAANALIESGKYEEGLGQLDEMAKDNPEDVALKQSRITGHLKFATYYMYNDTLPPKAKYPNALKQYRAVLKIDPNNENAKGNADMIINIYHSMGREVPEDN